MTSTPTIIVVRREADLATARRQAETALLAGRTVNVFAEHREARHLVVRGVPVQGHILLIGPSTYLTATVDPRDMRLDRHFADARSAFDGSFEKHLR